MPIPTASKTKNDANSALDTTAAAAKQAIDKTSGLTADQKQAAKDQIDQAVTAAKDNINKASDDTGVAAATDAGKLAIDKVSANAAIDGALAEKNNSIDTAPNLTDGDKQSVKEQAKKAADSAKTAISKASTVGDVNKAQTTGVENINKVSIPAQSDAKQDAINAINDAATAKKGAINGTDLTAEEKTALVNKAQKLADDAIADINKATTNDAVNTAKENGVETINNVNVPDTSATKDAAKDAIDKAAKTKDAAIDASNLTAEEKADLKQTVAGEVNKAKAAIDAATKDADVNTAQTNGEKAIDAVEIPASAAKTDAKNAIDQAAKTKDDAIDASNLTAEEKADLKKTVAAAANEAKDNIEAGTLDTAE
ncbi:hypothetical protein A3Q24_04420, partial [Lactobacillus johnsonii]